MRARSKALSWKAQSPMGRQGCFSLRHLHIHPDFKIKFGKVLILQHMSIVQKSAVWQSRIASSINKRGNLNSPYVRSGSDQIMRSPGTKHRFCDLIYANKLEIYEQWRLFMPSRTLYTYKQRGRDSRWRRHLKLFCDQSQIMTLRKMEARGLLQWSCCPRIARDG